MRYIVLLIVFAVLPFYAQELPTVIPPSPTVANLSMLEETTIGNHTGLPEISLSLASIPVREHLNVNVSISYNPLGIKVKDIASEVGLGWSLSGIGTISRNVVEYPDEYFESNSKIGIYHYNPSSSGINNYYDYLNSVINWNSGPFSVAEQDYMWSKHVKNLYDTKHDIWSFSFFGRSGRFVIMKQPNGSLKVEIIDKNDTNLKIINYYQSPQSGNQTANCYKPLGFKIIDEYGYEYFFEEVETTSVNSVNSGYSQYQNTYSESLNSLYTYNSAFHLTEVKYNNVTIIEVLYDNGNVEEISSTTTKFHRPVGDLTQAFYQPYFNMASCYGESFIESLFLKQQETSTSLNYYNSKKVQQINVPSKGSIHFDYAVGRQDAAFFSGGQHLKRLVSIRTNNILGDEVSKYVLSHQYFNAPISKLFLTDVKKVHGNNELLYRGFEYNFPNYYSQIFEDKWGFATKFNNKETDTQLVTSYVLNKIHYPTGGHIQFNYESNTYSSAPGITVVDYTDNPDNWNSTSGNSPFINQLHTTVSCFQITDSVNKVSLNLTPPSYLQGDWAVELLKDGQFYAGIINHNNFNSLPKKFQNLPIGNYTVKIVSFTIGAQLQQNLHRIAFTIQYLKPEQERKKYLFGAGIRLQSQRRYRDNQDTDPVVKSYFYTNFGDVLSSSGALNSPVPIFDYQKAFTIPTISCGIQGGSTTILETTLIYEVKSTTNAIVSSSMDQSQVGYKNVVSMSHTDDIVLIGDLESNGKIEYTYTNSVDYPDDFLSNTPSLYMPAVSNHFKRGLLTKETIYDRTNHKLNETLIEYDFDEDLLPTGVNIYSVYDDNNVHPIFGLFTNYNNFNDARSNNHCFNGSGTIYIYCGLPHSLLGVYNNTNIYRYISNSKRGWARQTQVQRLEYPSGTSVAIETQEQFYYNSFNKQISSTVKNYSSSDWEQQTFSYAHDLNNQLLIQKNMLVTPLVTQTIKNGQLQSKVETNYIDWGNGLVAPNFVSAAKSNQPLEVKVRYNQIDPITGNPRQVQMENGTYISYIWGYHNSLPVAKLENIAYNDIPAQLITAIQNATDATNYNESSVLTALEALRSSTDPNMQKAMITTYTHKPLIGISTVTDPRGQRQTYIYDDFNRLKEVRDHNDMLLSENEYYYRTQN